MDQLLIVHGELPHLNKVIRLSKGHWSGYSKDKKQWTEKVAWEAVAQNVTQVTDPAYIAFEWFTKDRRVDPDNVRFAAKYILDGLTKARVLPDDSMRWIRGFKDYFAVDKENPRVQVTLSEVRLP